VSQANRAPRGTVRLVMFDCDGVLFDSRQANILFYNELLRRLGRPPMTGVEVDYVHVHTAGESVAYLLRHQPPTPEAWQQAACALDYGPFIDHMSPEPTVHEALRGLKSRCRLAVCTNRTTTIGAVLAHHGLAGYFDLVVSAHDVPRPKPHPDELLRALEALGCPPEASLYVGDAAVDMEASLAAGVPFVAYRNPALEAAAHIDFLSQIAALIDASRH